ncbi:galactokinase [Winogradskyella aurantiaca]|uniref:galactokinase n=1 Tax=Winogradskyella aurantiaca TaxID=2219558 RepID=UPI001E616141|nr:galactokinase [Winogradskyella aurantiaca]
MTSTMVNDLEQAFFERFLVKPIVVFSPGRINFIGEHTDYNNGFVFPAAIDKGIYMALSRSTDERSQILALDVDESYDFDINDLQEEQLGSWQDYLLGVLTELKKQHQEFDQIKVLFSGTIAIGSGLSSSAALENAFVFGLNELFRLNLSKHEMIHISQAAEHNFVGVKCGIMDQFASMYGKEDAGLFLDCKTLESDEIPMQLEGVSLVLINSNVKHKLAESAYNKRRATCERVANFFQVESLREISLDDLVSARANLDEEDYRKASYVLEENERVLAFREAVTQKDIIGMGELLYQSHDGMRNKYEVSCVEIDFLVDFSKQFDGVHGSRMMGGGFGGCTINLVENGVEQEFIEAIKKSYMTKFNKTCNSIKVALSHGTRGIK